MGISIWQNTVFTRIKLFSCCYLVSFRQSIRLNRMSLNQHRFACESIRFDKVPNLNSLPWFIILPIMTNHFLLLMFYYFVWFISYNIYFPFEEKMCSVSVFVCNGPDNIRYHIKSPSNCRDNRLMNAIFTANIFAFEKRPIFYSEIEMYDKTLISV